MKWKTMGSCARRRKRKAQAILEAAASAVAAEEDGNCGNRKTAAAASVPSDRGYTLDGVKIRRLEEWKKCHQSSSYDADDKDDAPPPDSSLLHPKDEHALQSQLGFIPGNAICIAAREMQSSNSTPSVVKLYPLAIRESYKGGKSDGRAFKGRRRGTHHDRKKKKEDRAWRVVNDNNNATSSIKSEDATGDIGTKSSSQKSEQESASLQEEPNNNSSTNEQIIEPFPTLYWLTSPTLRATISKLELSKEYNVQCLETKLRSSPMYLQQMKRAHESYGTTRYELLTNNDRTKIIQRGWKNALDETRGVAGIRLNKNSGRGGVVGYDCVKCLHAHAAHYLAQVAEWEEEEEEDLEKKSCSQQKKKKKSCDSSDDNDGEKKEKKKECDRDDLNLIGKWTMEKIISS